MMVRFVDLHGEPHRILLHDKTGAWLISYDAPATPFFVGISERLNQIETPQGFLRSIQRSLSEAEKERLDLIQPLLDDVAYILNRTQRMTKARSIAEENSTTAKRVLRLYYRYLATGVLTEKKKREPQRQPDYDWAIRTYYFSSKKFSLRATYDMMLVQRYMDQSGNLVENAPTWSSFQHYFYKKEYHKNPQKVIARDGLSYYQRNKRPAFGSASQWRPQIGSYQMDATQADIYLVSRLDRSEVIGRPNIYIAVDTATQLIAGIYVGMEAGETAVMECLSNAACDKVSYCRKYDIEITHEQWPSSGVPREIITDKGREFCGKRAEELCMRYGVDIQSLPPFRPDGKGIVEKTFDLLQTRYKPYLRGHGVIETDAQERWSTDYREQAVLDMDQFTQIIIRCVIYLNSGRVLSDGETPAQMWLNSGGSLMQVDPRELHLMALPRMQIKLTRKGFHCNSLWYFPQEPEQFLVGNTYFLAVDGDDSSCIYIVMDDQFFPCLLADKCQKYRGANCQEVDTARQVERTQKTAAKKMEATISAATAKAIQNVIRQAADGYNERT